MKFRKKEKSILTIMLHVVMLMIFIQAALLTITITAGGVLSRTTKDSYEEFNNAVSNRTRLLQNEMLNRWSNIDSYVEQVEKLLGHLDSITTTPGAAADSLFYDAEGILIRTMRASGVNDCFIVLNEMISGESGYPALYFRDYSPEQNFYQNTDLCLLAGPSGLTQYYLTGNNFWSERLSLDKMNESFLTKPVQAVSGMDDLSSPPGYWCPPFTLSTEKESIITYSVPLIDKNGRVRGVMGIGILVSFLQKFLPDSDFSDREPLGYIIGFQGDNNVKKDTIISGQEKLEKIFTENRQIHLENKNTDLNIFPLEEVNPSPDSTIPPPNSEVPPPDIPDESESPDSNNIYACIRIFNLYSDSSPFRNEHWSLVGLMRKSSLLALTKSIQQVLLYSLLGSLILGLLYGVIASYIFTKPIVRLARTVRENNPLQVPVFKKTYLREVDELAAAIEAGNRNFIKNTLRMSQVLDMVDMPIGAFEYCLEGESGVCVTDKLKEILCWSPEIAQRACTDKQYFIGLIHEIKSNPLKGENHIYKLPVHPDRWVKLNQVEQENEVLGVVVNVTDEMLEKEKLKLERDIDVLTGLFNNRSFKKKVLARLKSADSGQCAMMMLDLDNLKKINDTYGHQFGDSYLKKTAQFLKEIRPGGCITGRRSGDEFFVFFYRLNEKSELTDIIDQFYTALENNPVSFPDGSVKPIAISGGIAWCDGKETDYETLLDDADQLLYQAKKSSKGRAL